MKTVAGLGALISFLLTLSILNPALAQDRLDMEGTSITGNKELPSMLYIVPWKETESVKVASPPVSSLMDKPLTLIERNAFRRQIRYHAAIFSNPAGNP